MTLREKGESTAMLGLEGAVLVPILILGCAAIIYYGLIHIRSEQREARRDRDS